LIDSLTRSWTNTPCGTWARDDPNLDNSSTAWFLS
jgi:hypothetical protein